MKQLPITYRSRPKLYYFRQMLDLLLDLKVVSEHQYIRAVNAAYDVDERTK